MVVARPQPLVFMEVPSSAPQRCQELKLTLRSPLAQQSEATCGSKGKLTRGCFGLPVDWTAIESREVPTPPGQIFCSSLHARCSPAITSAPIPAPVPSETPVYRRQAGLAVHRSPALEDPPEANWIGTLQGGRTDPPLESLLEPSRENRQLPTCWGWTPEKSMSLSLSLSLSLVWDFAGPFSLAVK